MRVLWFTDNPAVGANHLGNKGVGSAWILSLEAELTKSNNVELGVAFTCDQPNADPFTIDNSMYFPVRIPSVKNKFKQLYNRLIHKIENERYLQLYLDVVQLFKPDLIHIFGTEHAFGLIIPKINVPCIIHLQGNLTVINLKWYSGLTAIDVLKYSRKWPILKGYGIYNSYFINKKASARERKIFLKCKYFMGRTDWDRRISSVLSPDSKYFHCDEIMRPGFYLNQWDPQKVRKGYIIISTFRNNIYKGLETIYECKKILINNFPDLEIVWKIAGIREEDEVSFLVERKYRGRFKDIGIQLLGPLNEDGLIAEMLSADLFVHTSHTDNSPNSVCEAMLLGMPVIATYAGGTPSIICDKTEGLLVHDGDPYMLAGTILELFRNKDMAINLGENARIRSLARNDPHKIVNDLISVYYSILS